MRLKRFQGIPVFRLSFSPFKKGAALTLPGIGIFVGKGFEENKALLRHEFGHILQYRKWGFWFFWRHIAFASLHSARKSSNIGCWHQDTWTEWSANRLAYQYFRKPDDWNLHDFPIDPSGETALSKPTFLASNQQFIDNWIEGESV